MDLAELQASHASLRFAVGVYPGLFCLLYGVHMQRFAVSLLVMLSFHTGLAQRTPLPMIQPVLPGAVQPVPPGYQAIAPLPTLTLTPALPEVSRVEYASNGSIEVAHALILLPRVQVRSRLSLTLSQAAVQRTFAARPALAEVDVSVYVRETYGGFGGPSPLLTASVPRERLAAFLNLTPGTLGRYPRLWQNPAAEPTLPRRAPSGETSPEAPEPAPSFEGTKAETLLQRLEQALSGVRGPKADTSVIYAGSPRVRKAALTFDDAVHPLYEPLLLDTLRRAGAKATFFAVGRNIEAYPYFARDIVQQDHELANHTFHHVRLPGLSPAAMREELERTDDVIRSVTGQDARYFRPPGGRYSPQVLEMARSLGLTTAFWTDDPADFNNPGANVIETRLSGHLRPGGIVLLHDNAQQTIGLLGDFINDARSQGYTLVTLRDLAAQVR